ncbi:MAG: hypothetical protein RJA44_2126 [Pseudomonadota bacterium]
MFEIQMASLSDPGQRGGNEDALCTGQRGPIAYAVVADGAGGHQGGAIASSQVVADLRRTLEVRFLDPRSNLSPADLDQLIRYAHQRLQARQVNASGTARMHTTVVTLWLHASRRQALWSHVGDSRLYRLRYGAIDHISRDDSVVQHMVDAGLISAEQALTHPARHQLLAALGVEDGVEPRTLQTQVDLEDGDAFLLCTDGWWEPLGDALITKLCREAETPQQWLQQMQAAIQARNLRHQDNYSAVAVWVNDPTETTRSMAEQRG